MSVSTKLVLGFIFSFLSLTHVSCKKTDFVKQTETVNTNSIEEKFFNAHRTSDPTEKALIDFLKRVNAKDNFVEKTAKQIGYPRWDKTISGAQKKGNSNSLQNLNSTNQTFYIPFVRDSQNYVNASMIIHTSQTDTTFLYRCDWEYKQIENDPTSLNDPAEHFATFFMVLDKAVFGYNKFNITDTSLFSTANGHSKFVMLDSSTSSTTTNYMWVEYCQDVVYFYQNCTYQDSNECSAGCDQCYLCMDSFVLTYCWGEYVDSGEGGSGGGGTGGGGGGGGSTPPPCDQQPVSPFVGQNNLVEPCSGGGWIPTDDDPPFVLPYQCNYQLTQHEQDVFNQLDAEDDQTDQNHLNLDCQGTKRTGNIFFQGTKEHWMIQLDYVAKNPAYGDVEFAIPYSSPAGNRGYADIVNLQTKKIFEIKPDNQLGQQAGATEVANYILKANQYCGSTIPIGVPWSAGGVGDYTPTLLPTSTPNKYLKTRLHTSGVIVYSPFTTSNPVPAPVLVPSSVADKLKHLIGRLRLNFHHADRIIAEYLKDNPDLVTYIKGAAIGAGVAIIVGTILEDVITAGAGIADDWACFALSYRIIRFAVAL